MARPANNIGNQLLNDDKGGIQIVATTLEDYGIPAARAYQMARAFSTSTDFIKDVEGFMDNYNSFQQLQKAASSLDINLVEDLANDKLEELVQKVDSTWDWGFLNSTLPDGATDAAQCPANSDVANKQHLEQQIKELQEFKKTWSDVFSSKEAMQAKADELLTRNKWMKIIEIGLVFKDVCLGINQAYQTNKALQGHRQELVRINQEFIEPIMKQFNEDGTMDDGKVSMALMQLRLIKGACEREQKESAKSIWGHLANAVSMGFQAYASFKNGSALANVASSAALNWTYMVGAAQGGLAVGSLVLSGVESYNWIQYKNIIDDINTIIQKLEYYSNEIKRMQ